jgi:hypothetical protein
VLKCAACSACSASPVSGYGRHPSAHRRTNGGWPHV